MDKKSQPGGAGRFFCVFSAVFPVEFQGQEDGDGGGDDGQRQYPGQRQRENRGCYGFDVIDQSLSAPTEAKVRKVMRMATHRAFSVP